MSQQLRSGTVMGGKSTKKCEADSSGKSASTSGVGDGSAVMGLEEDIKAKLTMTIQDARVICRRPSVMNGDILIEEVFDESCTNLGTTTRRMRFCSNLALEQTEVRLFKWTRMVPKVKGENAKKKDARQGELGQRSNPFGVLADEGAATQGTEDGEEGSSSEEEIEMLVADSNYLPYECMQGMCLSFALLPRVRVEETLEEPLAVCVTGLAGGMLPRFIRQ